MWVLLHILWCCIKHKVLEQTRQLVMTHNFTMHSLPLFAKSVLLLCRALGATLGGVQGTRSCCSPAAAGVIAGWQSWTDATRDLGGGGGGAGGYSGESLQVTQPDDHVF